jgi:hypothetical protein
MKRCIAFMAALVLAAAITGCNDNGTKTDQGSNLDVVPLLIDRQILTDAVWGEGTDIPEDVACIASSQFTFAEVVNPLTIAKAPADSSVSELPTVVISSLNIYLEAGDNELRGETCPAGKLYFIVTASPETPIDVEVAGDTCPNLEEIATDEGVAFPQGGSAVAHFEAHEISLTIADLTKEETTTDDTVAEETTDETPDAATENTTDDETENQEETDPNTYKQKSFKLVIDECTVAEAAAE